MTKYGQLPAPPGAWWRLCRVALLAAVLSACGGPPDSLPELNASYEQAVARTGPLAARFTPDGPEEQQALARLQAYFAVLTPESVRERTQAVYAPGAYLNDTLVAIEGADRIQAYFSHALERAPVMQVQFIDHARVGPDYYVRWRMTVQAAGMNAGKPVVTYGMTQFRFDPEGRVLVHKDFWDAATGFYEHLPVLGGVLRSIRAVVERDAG